MPSKRVTIKANVPEAERDDANLLKAEIEAEYIEAKRARANPTKKRGKKLLKEEYRKGQMELSAPVDEREDYRRRILSMSLFPNLFNKGRSIDAAY